MLKEVKDYDWSDYIKKSDVYVPRSSLINALKFIEKKDKGIKNALDLGSGVGQDAFFLLKKGWYVTSVDKDSFSIKTLSQYKNSNLTIINTFFEDLMLNEEYDLINASFSLFFCKPNYFKGFWTRIINSLKIGGIFVGHFLGEFDEWSNEFNISFFEKSNLMLLLEPFEVLYFNEVLKEKDTLINGEKNWHYYEIIIKKVENE